MRPNRYNLRIPCIISASNLWDFKIIAVYALVKTNLAKRIKKYDI